ncbi:MAG: hypothetical protein K6G88_00905 [Lachnospiraceae bacterium]|jgi:V/A-type H+-transporting ATPase subunit E|nr:hypothetical protein [Lachnospiraceae bacterium]
MGGLEEIIKQIEIESSNEAKEIISSAERDCNKLKAENKKEVDALIEDKKIQDKAAADLALEKMKSGAQVKKKQDILRLKQKIIIEIIEKAHQQMVDKDVDSYFDMLIEIAKNNAHEEAGEIGLNAKDLARVPSDFQKKLDKAGLNLKVADKAFDIEDGMVLSYGDIEENCTIQALINSKKEILQDKVNKYIFG